MAQVLATSITTEGPQIDGRRWVHLRHTMADGTFEESSTLIDGSTTPIKLKNARVKEIDGRLSPPSPDPFLTKLDTARDAYLAGDRLGAKAALVEVKR